LPELVDDDADPDADVLEELEEDVPAVLPPVVPPLLPALLPLVPAPVPPLELPAADPVLSLEDVPVVPEEVPVVAAVVAAVPLDAEVDGDWGITVIPAQSPVISPAPLKPMGRAQLELSVPKICGMFTCTHRSWVRVMVTRPRYRPSSCGLNSAWAVVV
jgi:hypothetical protein